MGFRELVRQPIPKTTTEQLLPLVRTPEYNAPYTPAQPVEVVANIAQNAENVAMGGIEAGAIGRAMYRGGIKALKSIKPNALGLGANLLVDLALPDRANDIDEIAAIKNYDVKRGI